MAGRALGRFARLALLLICQLLMLAAQAGAPVLASPSSFLSWCPTPPAQTAPQGAHAVQATHVEEAEGSVAIYATAQQSCRNTHLPVASTDVLALQPVPAELAPHLLQWLTVHGVQRGDKIQISSVSPGQYATRTAADSGSPPVPLQEDLLPAMRLRTYGIEERVRAWRDGSDVVLECSAGTKSAGLALESPWILPRAPLSLQLAASGDGIFQLAMADVAGLRNESPSLIGSFDGRKAAASSFQVPQRESSRPWLVFLSIACPLDRARLTLNSLKFAPARASARVPVRSSWVWDPADWQHDPHATLTHALRLRVGLLYVSVPVIDGAVDAPTALAAFIRSAGDVGIQVWAVAGDPAMVLPSEQAKAVSLAQAYLSYNRSAQEGEALKGIQFDVEPYLLPGYTAAPEEWDRRYIDLVTSLHQATKGIALEMAVPFWWAQRTALLQKMAPLVSGLNVMDYQTDPSRIYSSAVPFLDWAAVHEKSMRVALEGGAIDTQMHWAYRQAASGELWLVGPPESCVLVFLRTVGANPVGPSFQLAQTHRDDPAQTTFADNPQQMEMLLPQLEARFMAWKNFSGLSIHGPRR